MEDSFQFSVFSIGSEMPPKREYDHAQNRRTGKALAERRRRTMQFHLAGFAQEEIAEKLGMHRSVVSRDLQLARDVCRRGDSPRS